MFCAHTTVTHQTDNPSLAILKNLVAEQVYPSNMIHSWLLGYTANVARCLSYTVLTRLKEVKIGVFIHMSRRPSVGGAVEEAGHTLVWLASSMVPPTEGLCDITSDCPDPHSVAPTDW